MMRALRTMAAGVCRRSVATTACVDSSSPQDRRPATVRLQQMTRPRDGHAHETRYPGSHRTQCSAPSPPLAQAIRLHPRAQTLTHAPGHEHTCASTQHRAVRTNNTRVDVRTDTHARTHAKTTNPVRRWGVPSTHDAPQTWRDHRLRATTRCGGQRLAALPPPARNPPRHAVPQSSRRR